jgi:hypothetical protein
MFLASSTIGASSASRSSNAASVSGEAISSKSGHSPSACWPRPERGLGRERGIERGLERERGLDRGIEL